MNFYEAKESMKKGIPVKSLVSYTIFEMVNEDLVADGAIIPWEHITEEEKNGSWCEIRYIETMEEFEQLTEDEKGQMFDELIKSAEFRDKHTAIIQNEERE